jgi:hypothetical protein
MIIPPPITLEKPITKAICVSITNTGAITIKNCTLTGATWKSTVVEQGSLDFTGTEIETGVSNLSSGNRGRGLLQIEGEYWPDVWFGSSLQLVGRTLPGKPFVFGEVDYKKGNAAEYPASSVIHTASRVRRMNSTLVTTEPYESSTNDRTKDRIIQTTISTKRAPSVAFVLWLESNQTGYLKCPKLSGFNSAVNISL